MTSFDGNEKIQRLRLALRRESARERVQAAQAAWEQKCAEAFAPLKRDAAPVATARTRKPRVTFCRDCGAPIYASAAAPFGIAVDSTHACQVAS